jgi:hypothetical protein
MPAESRSPSVVDVRSDRRVRLMSDYGVDWPLWGDEGELQPAALGLSDDLTARLQAWQRLFEERFHYESGWRSAEDAAAYAADGVQLQRLLTAEAG